MSSPETPETPWPSGWDGHALAQRRRWAALPLAQKLEWLEEAQRLAQQIERARESRHATERQRR